jgi:hypothetical protein
MPRTSQERVARMHRTMRTLAPNATGVALRDGSSVSEAAWALHQAFKYDLIATLPRAGGHIPTKTIGDWISTHPIVGADPLLSPLDHVDRGLHGAPRPMMSMLAPSSQRPRSWSPSTPSGEAEQ